MTVRTEDLSGNQRTGKKINPRWWTVDDDQVAEHAMAVAQAIEQAQEARKRQNLRYARLFANQRLSSIYDHGQARTSMDDAYLCFNVTQINIETAESKIAKNKPRVVAETTGGDWSQQRRAKDTSKFLFGAMTESGLYSREAGLVFLDGATFGTGWLKVWFDTDEWRIANERILDDEIIVDDTEALYGRPRSLFQKKWIHRDVLAEMFPKKRTEILDTTSGHPSEGVPGGRDGDMVATYEGWHLPASKGGNDGRRIVMIDRFLLQSKPFTRQRFPFARFTWGDRIVGIRGRGIAETLIGLQIELNEINDTISAIRQLASTLKIFVKPGAKLNTQAMSNQPVEVIETEEAPVFAPIQAVPQQLFDERDRLFAKSFELVGNSQLSATSTKPAGLNSGVSLREFHDIESARFVSVGQAWEQFFVDVAELYVDAAEEAYSRNRDKALSVRAKAPGSKFLETIDWAKVRMDRAEFTLNTFPVSTLPVTPAGKRATLQEWYEAGLIDRATFMGLMEMPDLEAVTGLLNAGLNDIKATIERILDEGKYDPPEPYQDLATGKILVQAAYLKAKHEKAPRKRLEMLLRWLDEADYIAPKAPPAAPAAPMDPAMAGAMPAPPMMPGAPPVAPDGAMPPPDTGNPALPSEMPVQPV